MFCSLKVLYRMDLLSTNARVAGSGSVRYHISSFILDENCDVPRTSQLSARRVQDLDLRSKLESPTRDEADSHLQLPCFTALDFPKRNFVQDPLVDHMFFGFKEHVCRENEIGRCSAPTPVRRHEQREKLVGTHEIRF